jgi:hypothetical protein
MMQIALWVAGVALAFFAIDRLALWAESRGWIYWRRTKHRGSAMSGVLSELNVIGNPSAEHVIVAKDAKKFEEKENGDGEPPGIIR